MSEQEKKKTLREIGEPPALVPPRAKFEKFSPSLRPEFRVSLPVPKAPTMVVARKEFFEIDPPFTKDILNHYYNVFTTEDTVQISPNDALDRLYSIFQNVVLPEAEKYYEGHLTHAEFGAYVADGFIKGICADFLKATRVLEDPALFGSTYADPNHVKGKKRFNCNWRGFTELDNQVQLLIEFFD